MKMYGDLNELALQEILISEIRSVMRFIKSNRFAFSHEEKDSERHNDNKIDYVTEIDKKAQRLYVDFFQSTISDVGIVAEEGHLIIDSPLNRDIYLTLDPIDGTKAFVRQQSHGISTMVSLVDEGDISAAYVGDVMTGELYGYGPHSSSVERRDPSSSDQHTLSIDEDRSLTDLKLYLRKEPWDYSEGAQTYFRDPSDRPFKSILIGGSSMGTQYARLWKGEVGGILLRPSDSIYGEIAPWDLLPVLGISQNLGFRHFLVDPSTGDLEEVDFEPSTNFIEVSREVLVVHRSDVNQLKGSGS